MEQKYTDETFLAKWLSGELSETERLAFEKTPEYKQYAKIAEKSEQFEMPEFQQDKVYTQIQEHTQKKQKVRKLIPNWTLAVAASVAVLLGVFFFTGNETVYTTSFGEQLAVVLPDGSQVQLNAKSELSFDNSNWKQGKRLLSLDGEAYFKVEKGSKFTVHTALGAVSVLGTQFNVKKTKDFIDVRCYEGSVAVIDPLNSVVLTPGMGYQRAAGEQAEHTSFSGLAPSWLSGESSFNTTPLKVVFEELEKQYKIKIIAKGINTELLYTGSFTNSNLEVALQTVCSPMQLTYIAGENSTVVITKNVE